ncbi:MAG TPA: PilZ domain-containing protein [Terriglobales bacterium]|nr:PilZ domain-containing protein [Terriglobales bacterium]
MNDRFQSEKRRSERIFCRVPVTLRSYDGREIPATCLDVNFNGVGLETEGPLSVGQRIELLVRKRNGDVTPVPMLVIFRMEKHYGLSALDAYEDVLELIPTQA